MTRHNRTEQNNRTIITINTNKTLIYFLSFFLFFLYSFFHFDVHFVFDAIFVILESLGVDSSLTSAPYDDKNDDHDKSI